MTDDLLLALLSLDSYNQGYAVTIKHGERQIGRATFIQGSATLDEAPEVEDGFYGAAYSVPGQGTVLSYRGTDFHPIGHLIDDAANGWSIGGGRFFAPQAGQAAELGVRGSFCRIVR